MSEIKSFRKRDDAESSIMVFFAAFASLLVIIPTMSFFIYFIATSSNTAVVAERQKALRSWAIDEFDTKPWSHVLEAYFSNEVQRGDEESKFDFPIRYSIKNLNNSGGYSVRLVAPRPNVPSNECADPTLDDRSKCIYYEYVKTPTLSEGIAPSWSGMNYASADIQPASNVVIGDNGIPTSPSLKVTTNRTVNIGTFDGCSSNTPDKIRLSFKWSSDNGIRPSSVQHLVINNEVYETTPLSSPSAEDAVWYSVTINKPQPSICFNSELVRIFIDNGARGTISDVYVAPLLSLCSDFGGYCTGDVGEIDENIPLIVSNPAWATDGISWYFTFQNPLTGPEISSYQIRGTGTKAECSTTPTTINKGNANNGVDSVLLLGQFDNLTDLKSKVCDRYYITTIGANGYQSPEISFLSSGINKVVSVDNTGTPSRPSKPTDARLTTDGVNWFLEFDQENVATIDYFAITGIGENEQCVTNQQNVEPDTFGGKYSLGAFADENILRGATCDTFKIVAVGNNTQTSSTSTFVVDELEVVE